MQSVPVTNQVTIQHYVIKYVSDLRHVGGFLRFPQPIKLNATILLKYCNIIQTYLDLKEAEK
jgi:hypothetical protein